MTKEQFTGAMESALRAISEKKTENTRMLVTLDGPCASGKTTLARSLAEVLACDVIHTDDFVVPHSRKTPERLAIPGGNCEWERLVQEVIAPWKSGAEVLYRKYDCRADRMKEPEPIRSGDILILEGSYCNLPAVRGSADVRVFMHTAWEIRKARLEKRESIRSLQMFYDRWIPLEESYFEAYGLPDRDCILTC